MLNLGVAAIHRQFPWIGAYAVLPELVCEFAEGLSDLLCKENAEYGREHNRTNSPSKDLQAQAEGAGHRQTGYRCRLRGDQTQELHKHQAQNAKVGRQTDP